MKACQSSLRLCLEPILGKEGRQRRWQSRQLLLTDTGRGIQQMRVLASTSGGKAIWIRVVQWTAWLLLLANLISRKDWQKTSVKASTFSTFLWTWIGVTPGSRMVPRSSQVSTGQLCLRSATPFYSLPLYLLSELQTHSNLHSPVWVGRNDADQTQPNL